MKIDELMVGDWYYWEAEGKLYPYQVKPEDFVKGEIPNFQPVPLTKEILEKNNFKFNGLYYEGVVDISKVYNKDIWNIGKTRFDGHGDPDLISFCTISYVHELQNLLRPLGVLNITL